MSLLAFQAAPIPTSTGKVTTAQANTTAGRADTVTRRTTPVVRSATRIVYRRRFNPDHSTKYHPLDRAHNSLARHTDHSIGG